MLDAAKSRWRKLRRTVTSRSRSDEAPRELLDGAIDEALHRRDAIDAQGRRLIAGQQAAEMQLNTRLTELSKRVGEARDSLRDPGEGRTDDQALQGLAERVVELDHSVRQGVEIVTGLAEAVDRARADLRRNARESQRLIAERAKMLSPIDQARQRDRLDRAMQALAEPLGPSTATAAEIERKLSARHAEAMTGRLHDRAARGREQSEDMDTDVTGEARDWLEELRATLETDDPATTA